MTLARDSISEEVEQLRKTREGMDENEEQRCKEHIIRRLKRVNGCTSGNIKAMKDEKGRIHTSTEGIITALQEHWAKVFEKRWH